MNHDEWADRHGISEAYGCRYTPSHMGGREASRIDMWQWRGVWLFCRCVWKMWPPPSDVEPPLDRGAPLDAAAGERIREAFERVQFFDAPEPSASPGLDGGTWSVVARLGDRRRVRETHSTSGSDWPFEAARVALVDVRPSLFRRPRSIAL